MKDWLLDHLPESLAAALFSVLGWYLQRKIARADALEARIVALERDKVTKADIEDLRESMNTTITLGNTRIESRTDEILLHLASRDSR